MKIAEVHRSEDGKFAVSIENCEIVSKTAKKYCYNLRLPESWMSGLSRTPGKRVWANPHRGFESRPLRHISTQVISVTWVFCCLAGLSRAQWLCVPRLRAERCPRALRLMCCL